MSSMLKNSLLWLTGLGETSYQLAMLERDGTIIECNKAWRAHAQNMSAVCSGWRKGENFPEGFTSGCYAPETRSRIASAWQATLADTKASTTTTYALSHTGSPRWYAATFKQFHAKEHSYVLATHEDVSDAKRREAALAVQLTGFRRMALVAEHTDRAVMILDPKGRIIWINPGFTNLLGYTLDEVSGRRPDVLDGPDSDPSTARLIERSLHAGVGADVEVLHYSKTGQALWIRSEIRPVRDASGQLENFVALEVDITDLKRTNETLSREREVLSAIVNGLPHLIAWKGHDLHYLGCNQQYASAAGLESPDAIVGLRASDIRALSDRADKTDQTDQSILETGEPVPRVKQTWRLPSGEVRIIDVNKMPLRLDSGLVNGILVMSADVTEDERVAKIVRGNEERWKRALEVNDVGVWDFDVATNKRSSPHAGLNCYG